MATVWDVDVSGPGTFTNWDGVTATQWDVTPTFLAFPYTVVLPRTSYHVVIGERLSMAAVDCQFIYASDNPVDPIPVPPKAPLDVVPPAIDWQGPVDCHDVGVTISGSVWSIHAGDDDGALVLSRPLIVGYVTSTLVAAGTNGKAYRLINTITTSDGRTISRSLRIEVGQVDGTVH